MEHPLISNLEDLTNDQLQEKINDLTQKLSIASRGGNRYLCDQIRMALESYRGKYNERMQKEWQSKTNNSNLGGKIDIS